MGKVCMVDIICYLCKDEEHLLSPTSALESPVSVILPKIGGLVTHVEPHLSLWEAIDLILQGAQNLVVPIRSNISRNSRKKHLQKLSATGPTMHNGREYCWLTQEDVIRYLLGSIGLFSPIPALSLDTLGIISTDVLAVNYHSPASSATQVILDSLANQTSVAVIDDYNNLIGEISPFTLSCCDETVAAAITTLSTGDLMSYIDCGGPPEDIVKVVKARLKERNLERMYEEYSSPYTSFFSFSSSSSSDDDELSSPSPTARSGRFSRSSSYSARMVRRAEAIVCHPGSSLIAVMIQAIAHRVNYVWVIEDDYSLAGIVTFCDMLNVFREHFHSIA